MDAVIAAGTMGGVTSRKMVLDREAVKEDLLDITGKGKVGSWGLEPTEGKNTQAAPTTKKCQQSAQESQNQCLFYMDYLGISQSGLARRSLAFLYCLCFLVKRNSEDPGGSQQQVVRLNFTNLPKRVLFVSEQGS